MRAQLLKLILVLAVLLGAPTAWAQTVIGFDGTNLRYNPQGSFTPVDVPIVPTVYTNPPTGGCKEGSTAVAISTLGFYYCYQAGWISVGGTGTGGTGTVTSVALTVPAWLSVSGSPITVSGTLAISAPGGQTSHQVIGTCGAGTSFAPCSLVAGDLPQINLAASGAGGVGGNLPVTNLNSGTSASSSTFWRGDGQWAVPPGSGTVTSVAQTVPSWLTVTGSPITTNGVLAISAVSGQTSHQVIGTCGSATSFTPCSLVAGDLPLVPLDTGVTGNLSVNNLNSGTGASGSTFWRGDGTWAQALSNPMTTLGDSIIGGASGVPTRLAGPTAPNGVPQIYTSTPSGGLATSEAWGLPGVPVNNNSETTCATQTLNVLDRATSIFCSGTSTSTFTFPVHTTTGFGSGFPMVIANKNTGTMTLTPTTDTIDTGTLPAGWADWLYNNSSGNWQSIQVPMIGALSGTATKIASAGFTNPASPKCVEVDASGNLQIAGSNAACGAGGGGAAWDTITNPSGNQALSMAGLTSTWTYTSALAGALKLQNTTAATSGTSQSSPVISLFGQGWSGGSPANTAEGFNVQYVIPNGANSVELATFTLTSSSTSSNKGYSFDAKVYLSSTAGFNIGLAGNRLSVMDSSGFDSSCGARGHYFSTTANIDGGGNAAGLGCLKANLLTFNGSGINDELGIAVGANSQRQVTSSYTNATTTPSTVLSWTLAATAHNYAFSCKGTYQSSASTATLVVVTNSSVAPTQETATATVWTTLTGTETDATVAAITSSGDQTILTGATPNATGTNYKWEVYGVLEEPAAGGTFAIKLAAGGTGTITVPRDGLACYLY